MLNAVLVMTTLNLTSRVNLAQFVIMLLKESKFPTFCRFLVYHNFLLGMADLRFQLLEFILHSF
jgi:hypothetical protein